MRLIDTTTLSLVDVVAENAKPYAILSHTWEDDEVTFEHMRILSHPKLSSPEVMKDIESRAGYQKIQQAAALARGDNYDFIWIDTCCIDQASSAELSEAINSMFSWYRDAAVCYAYLFDVPRVPLAQSRWFKRGWTLQELIAPCEAIFFSGGWQEIGRKTCSKFCDQLADITGIDRRVLLRTVPPADVSVANRMRWAAGRNTTRREDVAYCLMGIFGVNMPLLYGEGDRAFIRLQEEILKVSDDTSIFAWEQDDGAPGAPLEGEALYSHDRLSGLLASSPEAFANVEGIRGLPRPPTLKSMPCTMTNQGLHLSMYLQPMPPGPSGHSDSELYIAFLDCYVLQRGEHVYPTLVLRKLQSDQFARSGLTKLLNRRGPLSEQDQPSGHGYQDFYVRQEPRHFLPDVLIASNDAYRVIDIFPPQCWYSDSHAQLAAVLSDVSLLRASWDWRTKETEGYPVIPKTLENPLHLAAAYGSPEHVEEMFDVLLGEGSGLTTRNAAGETPLHRACAAGNTMAVRRIMRSDQTEALLWAQDELDRSPLWHAACAGQWEIIQVLLRRAPGGLVDFADSEGRTPLHAACREGHSEAARVLLDAGADPAAAAGATCFTPAHMAALMGHATCLEVLWKHPRVSKSHMGRTLQNMGSDDFGLGFDVYCTPFHLAVANGHQDCVEVLLQVVANPISSCTHFITVSHEQNDDLDTPKAMVAIAAMDAGDGDRLAAAIFEPSPGPTGSLWRATVKKALERGRGAIDTRRIIRYTEMTSHSSGLISLARFAARLTAPLAALSTRTAGNVRDRAPVKLLEPPPPPPPPPPPRERTPDSAASSRSSSSCSNQSSGTMDSASSHVGAAGLVKWSARRSNLLAAAARREEDVWERELAYGFDR
ncbi:hypothetical protein GGTG_09951 [Gaeumannomyces tritici R3-111a-1]|uniref:Uncharacterized protein n=1 Tax=Gaeumannomyces tritici (strain R3-111a-1) TaxID=644352 RepID=J3P8W7_GAET3|nr:hypothetical protein GGTG_09951 [Gaeumannomyces tritici R3-111a-1]EJT73101.1 hypothetical protein GGTG_09951 [Gaeumannomyces tritici R3-111a-1]